MHIALAPFRLKAGITEEALLRASDEFQERFVQRQNGILERTLVKHADGYADLVVFADAEAMARVLEAEQESEVCAAFMALGEDDGVREFDVLRRYHS